MVVHKCSNPTCPGLLRIQIFRVTLQTFLIGFRRKFKLTHILPHFPHGQPGVVIIWLELGGKLQ